ncbi:MAG: transcription antitermination factor NusB [Candidatus Aminicenantes bacterium]|nr:transcription antitermination factor NusB [Candidatus Aminicenantes bacterium]
MGQRRRARECALQILFQLEFNSGDPAAVAAAYWTHQKVGPDTITYAEWLVAQVHAHQTEVDELIQAASENWRLARMAVVERNILRIAVAELLYEPSLVPAIVIDEAIEVAKRFSGEEAAVFVNGVLDAVHGRLAGRSTPRPKKEKSHERKRAPRVRA